MNKDKIILKDESVIELEGGASLGSMVAIVAGREEAMALWAKLTADNVSKVSFQTGEGMETGSYTDLTLLEPHFAGTVLSGGTVKVEFGLREKTEMEKMRERIAQLEAGQKVLDGAVADLGAVTSTIAEQVGGEQ